MERKKYPAQFIEILQTVPLEQLLKIRLSPLIKGEFSKSKVYETITTMLDKVLIELALRETGGNISKAAFILGINRNTLTKKVKAQRIKPENFKQKHEKS